jgi:hypothetical protein
MNTEYWNVSIKTWETCVAALLRDDDSLGNTLRAMLTSPSAFETSAALEFLRWLDSRRLECIADQVIVPLLHHASYQNGFSSEAQRAILLLPRGWLIANIERFAAPIVQAGNFEDFCSLLDLYHLVDPGLARRLAAQGVSHAEYDIRECSSDYLLLHT